MKFGQTCPYCGQNFRTSPHKPDDCPAYLRERVVELRMNLWQCSNLLNAAIKRMWLMEHKRDEGQGRVA